MTSTRTESRPAIFSVSPTPAFTRPARATSSGGGVRPSAMTTTRPARMPSRIARVESSSAHTRTLATSKGAGGRCQSLDPTATIRRPSFRRRSHISIAAAISPWRPLVISIPVTPSGTACSQPQPTQVEAGWLIENTAPRDVAAFTSSPIRGSPASTRKSTASRSPPSPQTLAWPPGVVTSSPTIRSRPSAGTGSTWCVVLLWSVMARKSSPASRARRETSSTVSLPSLCTVWTCSAPEYQRAPRRSGSAGRGFTAAGTFGDGPAVVSNHTSTDTPASDTLYRPRATCHRPAGIGPGQ